MMFKLILQDRNGKALKEGDVVKISDGRRFTFYAEVKYLDDEKVIAPFHTFSFHSFEKIDKLPKNLIESTETKYRIWWHEKSESDADADSHRDYLTSWRECEYMVEKRCYRIEPIKSKQTQLF